MAGQTVVLAVQDTTQFDSTHHPATTGLGLLTDTAHQGRFYHPTLLVTPEKVPRGVAEYLVWERPRKSDGHPGSTVIWRGLQRLQDLAAAWRLWCGA